MTTGRDSYPLAVMSLLLSTLIGVGMNAVIKDLDGHLDAWTIIFLRSLVALPFLLAIINARKVPLDLSIKKMSLHFPRTVTGMVSYGCLIIAIQNLPLAEATAVSLSQPLIVALLAPFLLKEKFSFRQFLMIILGFLGILLILKPTGEIPLSSLLIIAAHPFLFALAVISLRHLGKTEDTWTTVFYYTLFSAILTAPWALLHLPAISISAAWQLALIAAMGIGLQFFQSRAFELSEATRITPFYYSAQIWSLGLGIAIWGEWPDAWAWLGMGLIITMGLMLNFMARPQKLAL